MLRGPDADSLATLVDNTSSASTSYTDHDVEPETSYVYAVRALNASGAGEASVSAAATTQKAPEEPIAARQDSGVCDRTDAVEMAIIAAVNGVGACGDVTSAHLEGILSLSLFGNSIDGVQSGDFAGLTALTELAIKHTSVKSLPSDIFAGLTALTELNFANSSLESLPAGVFDELTSLTLLDLRGNSLESLQADVFDDLAELRRLYLTGNALTELPAGVLANLPMVGILDLSDNPGSDGLKPTANAGERQLVELNTVVSLDGSDSDGGPWGSTSSIPG